MWTTRVTDRLGWYHQPTAAVATTALPHLNDLDNTVGDFVFHLNLSFKPELNLDPKIQFKTNAEINYGLKLSLKPGLELKILSS